MEQKATMWIVIFFLILAFILINTLSTEQPIKEETQEATNLPAIGTQLSILIIIITTLLFIAYHHHHHYENKKQEAQTPEHKLDQFIRQSLLEGQEETAIKQALLKAGWKEKIINQCLRRARFF